jgi:hypothetical protein
MAMVTGLVAVLTWAPEASSMVTATEGVIEAPTATLEGCPENASFAGGPTVLVTVTMALPFGPFSQAAPAAQLE